MSGALVWAFIDGFLGCLDVLVFAALGVLMPVISFNLLSGKKTKRFGRASGQHALSRAVKIEPAALKP